MAPAARRRFGAVVVAPVADFELFAPTSADPKQLYFGLANAFEDPFW
jgi:hypothetical protein